MSSPYIEKVVNPMRNNRGDAFVIGILIVCLVIVVFAVLLEFSRSQVYEITGTVTAKHIDPIEGGSAYVVIIDGNRALEVNRYVWDWSREHNPDIVYPQIEIGKTYVFKCWGWENEVWYWYPNIFEVTEVTS